MQLVTLYGAAGVGKTVHALWTMPDAVVISPRAETAQSVEHTLGFTPVVLEEPIASLFSTVRAVLQDSPCVVIDDWSRYLRMYQALIQSKYPQEKDLRKIYHLAHQGVAVFIDSLVGPGRWIVFTAEEREPGSVQIKDGAQKTSKLIRGGMAGPSRGSRGITTYGTDTVYRVTSDTRGRFMGFNDNYEGKDRYNVIPKGGKLPLSLPAVMLARGVQPPLPKEWQWRYEAMRIGDVREFERFIADRSLRTEVQQQIEIDRTVYLQVKEQDNE